MKKIDLVKELSKRTGETHIRSNFLVDEIFSIVEEAIVNEEKVYLPIGIFSTKKIEGTNRVTNITGEPVEYFVPPRRRVMFKTSKSLKDKLMD